MLLLSDFGGTIERTNQAASYIEIDWESGKIGYELTSFLWKILWEAFRNELWDKGHGYVICAVEILF